VQLGHNEWLLELFQGPTLALKISHCRLLGRLLDYVLEVAAESVVLGATSGDTGSAAIQGWQRWQKFDIFILHPLSAFRSTASTDDDSAREKIHNIATRRQL